MGHTDPRHEEHYELFLRTPSGNWQIVEVDPFTRNYEFDVEQAAIDKARNNEGDTYGYRVMKVKKTYSIAHDWPGSADC